MWINKGDPSAPGNTNILSDVVTVLDSSGRILSESSTSTTSTPTGSIIDYCGEFPKNSHNHVYFVYNKRPLNVINDTNSPIKIRTVAGSSYNISAASNLNNVDLYTITFPANVNSSPTNSQVITIPSSGNNSSTIVSSFPSDSSGYTLLELWKGSNVTTGTPVDFVSVSTFIGGGTFSGGELLKSWSRSNDIIAELNESSGTLTIKDNSTGDGIKLPNSTAYNVNDDCSSNLCKNDVCMGKSGNGGSPWWDRLIIAIVIIIIIITVIIFIFSSSNKKDNTSDQSEQQHESI